jgi:hypothetical protein
VPAQNLREPSARVEVAPERNQELAGQGDDHHLANSPARGCLSFAEPVDKGTVWLVALPGSFNKDRAKIVDVNERRSSDERIA